MDLSSSSNDKSLVLMKQWLLCFVVCNFNVDVGPEIELVYPPETPFSHSDLSNICFNSFPERHDNEWSDDLYFSFTMRNNSPDINLMSPAPPHGSADELFGVSVFRQEYDSLQKRRYNQKSLVVISNHEFTSFFMSLLRVLTIDGVISNIPRLEAACVQIASWPAPNVGTQVLPFLGSVFKLEIPPYPSFPLQGLTSSTSACSGLLNDLSVSEPPEHWQVLLQLLPSPSALYLLYERALLGQSIIILGQNPQHTSAVVHAIVDLIRPVPFAGIVRPYMPMQSVGSDMTLFDPASHGTESPISMLVGITNPFLLQRITRGPNPPYILALNSQISPQVSTNSSIALSSNSPSIIRNSSIHRRAAHRVSSVISSASVLSTGSAQNVPNLTRIDVPGSPISNQARPTRFLKSERKWAASELRPGAEGSATLRMHFAHLTARILSPINRSLATKSLSNNKDAKKSEDLPRIESPHVVIASRLINGVRKQSASQSSDTIETASQFPVDTFIAQLPRDDSTVTFQGQTSRGRQKAREEFYASFCKSENFAAWLEEVAGWVGKKAEAGVLG